MDSSKLSIFCADHHRFQAEIFKSFLDSNDLVDCTIAAGGEYLKAHKLILSACSSYFQILFTQEKERNPIVILKDINYEELKSIIEFVYCGEVKIPADRLAPFLDAAQCLQIKGLEGVVRRNKNPNSEVDGASQAYSREEISTTSDKNFQSNKSNGSEECASQFEQMICAINLRNISDNPAQVQLCQLDATCSPAVLSHQTSSTKERERVLGSKGVATNISTLPAPVTKILQPNFHSSEDYPPVRDPLIEMEPSEAMSVEPKTEVVHDASVGKSVTNNTIEMEEVFVPYEDIQYCDTCIETEQIEAVLPEPKSEHDALLGNMSVTNEVEEDKSPVPHEENWYPGTKAVQSSQSSSAKDIAPALGVQHGATNISTPVVDISQRNFQSSEVLPPITDSLIKVETSEEMFLEARAEDIHDESVGNTCITNDRNETRKENSPVSYKENQYSGIPEPCERVELLSPRNTVMDSSQIIEDANTQKTPAAYCLRRGERAADLLDSPGPDNSKDVTEEIATRVHPRRTSQPQRKRAQGEYGETTGANDMSYRFSGREEMSHGRPEGLQAFSTALGGNVRPQHSVERQYQCDVCGVAFQFPSALKKHMRKHTGERPYRCEVCSATFPRKGTLNSHMRCHTGERPHRCEVCSATFPRKGTLEIHMRNHTGERPHRCEVCSAAFIRKAALNIHMRRHTGELPHRCEVCSAAFCQKGLLKIHMRAHTGERPHQCEVCSAAFSRKGGLNSHMRSHTGERPYRCEVCSATFPRKGTLKIHMRKHTGERPHRCEVCSAAFIRKETLMIHMRRHTGERPHRCDVCSSAFFEKTTLKIHMRRHTGERPYRCDVCSAAFIAKKTLKTHVQTHRREATLTGCNQRSAH